MSPISADREAFLSLGPAAGLDGPRFAGSQRLLVASEHGRVVARCAARLRDDGIGTIGFFEAAHEPDAVRDMLLDAARWLRARGAASVVGPMEGDTWHRYRVNCGPYHEPPFLLEPVNPPYYDALWRRAGFATIERYSSKRVDDVGPLAAKLASMDARAAARGYRIRPFDRTRLRDELTLIWKLSLEIFRGNLFYSDIELGEFLELYEGVQGLLAPDLALFAETQNGEPAGFLFAYPDSRPGLVDYKTIGVTPAHRRGYVGWAMLHRAYTAAVAMGRPAANHCLMHDGNASQSMDAGHGATFRNYSLYVLPPS